MDLPMTLLVGMLMLSDVQASDIADGSKNHWFLSKYMPLRRTGYSKSFIGDNGKFMAHHLNHMQHRGGPEASLDHNDLAEDEGKDLQKLSTNASNKPTRFSAVGVALLSFAAMVGVRIWRGMQPAIFLSCSDGDSIDMSIPMEPVSVDNALDLKSQGYRFRIPEQVLQGAEGAPAKELHADIKRPFALWDPFGLGEAAPEAHVEDFRQSELQHGRAAIAAVFFVYTQNPRPMHTLMLGEGEDGIEGAPDASSAGLADDEFEVELERPLGVTVQEGANGRVFVQGCRAGGRAQEAGVAPGDEIIGVSAIFGDAIWGCEGAGLDRVEGLIRSRQESVTLRLRHGTGETEASTDMFDEEDVDTYIFNSIFDDSAAADAYDEEDGDDIDARLNAVLVADFVPPEA